jgi:uncharacterized membrane protein YfcA
MGAGGGLLSGVVGGGGGAIMVPLMTGVLKMSQHTAHGTSLVVIVGTALAAAITYSLDSPLDWALVVALFAGSSAGAYVGAHASSRLPALRLRQAFGLFLMLVAARLLLFPDISALLVVSGWREELLGIAIGFFGGLTSGALGVGGGAVFVPALVILLGSEQHAAQGISLWVVVCSSLVGAVTHYRLGTVDLNAARWIAPVAVPAGIAGAVIATQLDAGQLQAVFSLILVAIGLQATITATTRLRAERTTTTQRSTDPAL